MAINIEVWITWSGTFQEKVILIFKNIWIERFCTLNKIEGHMCPSYTNQIFSAYTVLTYKYQYFAGSFNSLFPTICLCRTLKASKVISGSDIRLVWGLE